MVRHIPRPLAKPNDRFRPVAAREILGGIACCCKTVFFLNILHCQYYQGRTPDVSDYSVIPDKNYQHNYCSLHIPHHIGLNDHKIAKACVVRN